MGTVQHVLEGKKGPVHGIDPDASVLEAAKRTNALRIGALVVVRDQRVIGIVSIGDLNEFEHAAKNEKVQDLGERVYWLQEYLYGSYR